MKLNWKEVDELFPTLKNKYDYLHLYWQIEKTAYEEIIFMDDVINNCLDKQKVKEILNKAWLNNELKIELLYKKLGLDETPLNNTQATSTSLSLNKNLTENQK